MFEGGNFGFNWGLTPWQIKQLVKRELKRSARLYARQKLRQAGNYASKYIAAKWNSGTGSTAMVPYQRKKGPGRLTNYEDSFKQGAMQQWFGGPYTKDRMKYEDWYEDYYAEKKRLTSGEGKSHKGLNKSYSGTRYMGLSRKRNY